ncbi:MAG TPA: hypothetical protein PLW65_12985 [Pseudomonadota bacterium]|nr:hypothetical protein [Pseudomonadota bacterium]
MVRAVERVVNCFDRHTEELEKKLSLKGITLQLLQKIFHVPADDPMYDSFRVEPHHAEQLQPYLLEKLDLEHCECFLDCDAIDPADRTRGVEP